MVRGKIRRREAVRTLAGAAAATGLVGLAPAGSAAAAAPQSRHDVLQVPIQLYVVGIPINKTSTTLIQEFIDKSFNSRHKGVRAIFTPPYNETAVISSILSGSGFPWIVSSCCTDWPTILPFLEPLDGYLKSENIDVRAYWGPTQLASFQTPQGLFGLPEDATASPYLYRQDILDELGLSYPDPQWTYTEAESLWRKCTGSVNGKWRYGTSTSWPPGIAANVAVICSGFGGALMDASQTRCELNQPAAVRAGQWWFHLVWDKVATWSDGYPNPDIVSGRLVFVNGADPTILWAVTNLGYNVKWDFIPFPRFPVQPIGGLTDNFYGMVKAAPNKELAWELLKWAAVDTQWSRFYMHIALAPPGRADIMDEWYAILRASAPILRNKHLEYWGQATLEGYAVSGWQFFKYESVQIQTMLNTAWQALWNHQLGVTEQFDQLTRQINALEATAAAAASAQAAQTAALQAALKVGPTGQYAPPPATGLGSPAVAAPGLVRSTASGVVVTGTGPGVNGPQDAGVMACGMAQAATASFSCQLGGWSVTAGSPGPWGLAGLMARGDLSDAAAFTFVGVAQGHGLVWISRQAAGQWAVLRQLSGGPWAGLVTAAGKLARPVWLRLRRSTLHWTAEASLDGSSWTALGAPLEVDMAGVWVGPFVTGGQAGSRLQASFVHPAGFAPTRAVRFVPSATLASLLQPTTAPTQEGLPNNTPYMLMPHQRLQQLFTVSTPIIAVAPLSPTWTTADSGYTVTLRQGPSLEGPVVARQSFRPVQDNSWPLLSLPFAFPPGSYVLEISDPVGPAPYGQPPKGGAIGWWGNSKAQIAGATAYQNGKKLAGELIWEYYPAPSGKGPGAG